MHCVRESLREMQLVSTHTLAAVWALGYVQRLPPLPTPSSFPDAVFFVPLPDLQKQDECLRFTPVDTALSSAECDTFPAVSPEKGYLFAMTPERGLRQFIFRGSPEKGSLVVTGGELDSYTVLCFWSSERYPIWRKAKWTYAFGRAGRVFYFLLWSPGGQARGACPHRVTARSCHQK
jgi:hypothetical protein